jgi:Raf kinase inhibitor-like YbhB/YbcL family protein
VRIAVGLAAVALLLLGACGDDDDGNGDSAATTAGGAAEFDVSSPAFADGAAIPVEYTCDGENRPVPVSWSGAPGETASYVLIMDDPDAGDEPYVHWVMYDIPNNSLGFESVSRDGRLPNGAAQGVNSGGEIGYTGPCPPSGTHTYVITVYALDTVLDLEPGADREIIDEAIAPSIIAEGAVTGTYSR